MSYGLHLPPYPNIDRGVPSFRGSEVTANPTFM
jgi:hypothetical protein